MPFFAASFGSVGDFVNAIQLAIKLSDLLIRRRGARSSVWVETQLELDTLNKELSLLKSHQIRDPLVSRGIEQELKRCNSDVQALVQFLKDTLDQSLWQKVVWTISEEGTLATLKAKITGRRNSLTFLLGLMNSGALQAARARLDEVHRQVGDANTVIVAVAHDVSEIGSQVQHGNATIDTIAHGVDGIAHSVDGIAHSVGMANHANALIREQFATYQAQIVQVVTHLPRGVANDIFFVLSPTGVAIPISILYCTTYEKLDGILKANLRDQRAAGARYVEQGLYEIVSSGGDIVSSAEFNAIIRGSVCLEISIAQPVLEDTQKCPQCSADCQIAIDGWYECENPKCRSKYRIFPSFPRALLASQGTQEFIDDDDDDVESFRRIHIVDSASSIPIPHGERFICEICGKSFNRAHDRKRHHETQHISLPVSHRCVYCEKDFSRADSLKRHIQNGCEEAPP